MNASVAPETVAVLQLGSGRLVRWALLRSCRPALFRKRQFAPAVIVICVRWYTSDWFMGETHVRVSGRWMYGTKNADSDFCSNHRQLR